MNFLNTKTHSSKERAKFSVENADVKSIHYYKERMKSKLSPSSECVKTKLCKKCASFTSHLHSLCGTVWYRTLRVKARKFKLKPRLESALKHWWQARKAAVLTITPCIALNQNHIH